MPARRLLGADDDEGERAGGKEPGGSRRADIPVRGADLLGPLPAGRVFGDLAGVADGVWLRLDSAVADPVADPAPGVRVVGVAFALRGAARHGVVDAVHLVDPVGGKDQTHVPVGGPGRLTCEDGRLV